jgi:three-Cys-motif partner protein
MTSAPFKFDEIGYWSELKLEIVEKYGSAYTKAFKNTRLRKYYIDGLSGAGVHVSRKTATQIEGSPSRAFKISPPFDGYYFIDIDKEKTSYLQKSAAIESMCIFIQVIVLSI